MPSPTAQPFRRIPCSATRRSVFLLTAVLPAFGSRLLYVIARPVCAAAAATAMNEEALLRRSGEFRYAGARCSGSHHFKSLRPVLALALWAGQAVALTWRYSDSVHEVQGHRTWSMRLRGLAAKRANLGERKLLITRASVRWRVSSVWSSYFSFPVLLSHLKTRATDSTVGLRTRSARATMADLQLPVLRRAGCLASWLGVAIALERLVIWCKCQAKPKRLTVARNLEIIQPSVSTMSLMHPPHGQHAPRWLQPA